MVKSAEAGREKKVIFGSPWSQSTYSQFGLGKMSNEIYNSVDLKCYFSLDFA